MKKSIWSEDGVGKAPSVAPQGQEILKDILLTMAAALWTGLTGSILFILLIVMANESARAAGDMPSRSLTLYAVDGCRVDVALLRRTDVRIERYGMLAKIRVEQQFINPGSDWLEGIYQFPLPENSAMVLPILEILPR